MSVVAGVVLIILIITLAFIMWYLIRRKYVLHGKIIVTVDKVSRKVGYLLEIDIDPFEIQNMKRVSFEVVKQTELAESSEIHEIAN